MKVKLLSATKDPVKVIFLAARICHSAKEMREIEKEFENKDYVINLLSKLYKIGHHSIFEHASFTFLIVGISRVTSHQLVRHRIASFSQRSQRYSKLTEKDAFALPQTLKNNKDVQVFLSTAKELYQKLIKEGIHQEDARYILPQAVETRLIMTMNLRELFHFWKLRIHPAAQKEIRELAKHTKEEVMKSDPLLQKLISTINQ